MRFSEKVYKVCKKIPKGKISTYKLVAFTLKTKAYRTVGGYAKGTKNKIKILRKEGIKIRNNKIDLKKYLFKV